jgi:hypothetical protein
MLVERAFRSQSDSSMRTYLIHGDKVTILPAAPKPVPADTLVIRRIEDFDEQRFPLSRLVALWNALPGNTPINRFQSRSSGLKRLWEALEAMPLEGAREGSKQAQLISLLRRPEGASIDELTQATGWQPHSVRGVVSGVLRKKLVSPIAVMEPAKIGVMEPLEGGENGVSDGVKNQLFLVPLASADFAVFSALGLSASGSGLGSR